MFPDQQKKERDSILSMLMIKYYSYGAMKMLGILYFLLNTLAFSRPRTQYVSEVPTSLILSLSL